MLNNMLGFMAGLRMGGLSILTFLSIKYRKRLELRNFLEALSIVIICPEIVVLHCIADTIIKVVRFIKLEIDWIDRKCYRVIDFVVNKTIKGVEWFGTFKANRKNKNK